MLAYVIRRILSTVPVLLGSTFLVQLCIAAAGDPLASLKKKQPPVPPAQLAHLRHELHLDTNIVNRYVIWLKDLVLHGSFGASTRGINIGQQLEQRVGITLSMVLGAMILAVIFAIISGVVSAGKRYSATDNTLTFFGFLFLAMPAFWLAALLKDLAIQSNQSFGTSFATLYDIQPGLGGGLLVHLESRAWHLVLPTVSLALISFAAWSRFQRASMIEVLDSDYVRLARSKGLSRRRVLVRHALRTALIPFVTVVAIDVGGIFGGAIITEQVFSWHGMGEMLGNAVTNLDANEILAWLLVSGLFVIVFNLFADLLYAVLDPRIRLA